MSLETVGANGQNVKKGKEGFVRFKFPANHLGLPAFTGQAMRAYVQDWSLSAQFKNQDVTPLGYDGTWNIPDGVDVSGNAKFNFRTDSAVLLGFTSCFADIIDHAELPANDTETPADPTIVISAEFFLDSKHYYEAEIVLESASTGSSAGGITSYDVSFKVNGKPTYHRLTAPIVES